MSKLLALIVSLFTFLSSFSPISVTPTPEIVKPELPQVSSITPETIALHVLPVIVAADEVGTAQDTAPSISHETSYTSAPVTTFSTTTGYKDLDNSTMGDTGLYVSTTNATTLGTTTFATTTVAVAITTALPPSVQTVYATPTAVLSALPVGLFGTTTEVRPSASTTSQTQFVYNAPELPPVSSVPISTTTAMVYPSTTTVPAISVSIDTTPTSTMVLYPPVLEYQPSAEVYATPLVPETTPLLSQAQLDAVSAGTFVPNNNNPAQLGQVVAQPVTQQTDTTSSVNPLLPYKTSYGAKSLIPKAGSFNGSAAKADSTGEINLVVTATGEQNSSLHQVKVTYVDNASGSQLTYALYDNNGLIVEDFDACKYLDSSGRTAQLPPFPNLNSNTSGDYNIYHWIDAQRSCPAQGSYPVRLGFRIFDTGSELTTIMDIYRGDQHIGQNAYVYASDAGPNLNFTRRSYVSYEYNTEYIYRHMEGN